MKKVTIQAEIDPNKCMVCNTCTHFCPVYAIRSNLDRPVERAMIPPCTENCPVGNDVERFIRLLCGNKIEEALHLLQKTNPFPGITGRVCFHPCENACNRKDFDSPLSIADLERYMSECEVQLPSKTPARPSENVDSPPETRH